MLFRSCREVAFAPPLLALLHDLYGEPARLFKDKLIFKPPGVKGYGLHQDWIAWPGFPRSFLTVLAVLYGEPARLFKDKLIYKPPGVKGYGLHQDWIAWPGFPRSFLTVLVPFDVAERDNGCTVV